MAKYTTLTELAEAFKRGELDDGHTVTIDKGGCALTLHQHKDFGYSKTNDPEVDAIAGASEEEAYEKCQEIFDREYGCCLEELFKLAGVPCEWV